MFVMTAEISLRNMNMKDFPNHFVKYFAIKHINNKSFFLHEITPASSKQSK